MPAVNRARSAAASSDCEPTKLGKGIQLIDELWDLHNEVAWSQKIQRKPGRAPGGSN